MGILRLETDIYRKEKIAQAIHAYEGYAVISSHYEDKYCMITFTSCKYDENRTIMEFENYLIGLENS